MPQYPLSGPEVQSIFEYIKFEQENIHLGSFVFDFLPFFGLVPGFNYNIDFFSIPADDSNGSTIYSDESYGFISTCDLLCTKPELEFTYNTGQLIAGPAIRILAGSTKDNFTAYGLVYNPFSHEIVFAKWINQPLTNYGTILFRQTGVTLVNGDKIKLAATANTKYAGYLNGIQLFEITNASIASSNICVGPIQLRASTTVTLINQSLDPFLTDYTTRRFYYCSNGIIIADSLIPTNPSNNYFEDSIDIALNCGGDGDKCYGFYYAQGFTNTDVAGSFGRGYYTEFEAVYGGALSGSPITGLAFRIDETKADPNDFTGYVVFINESNGKIQLCYYENESLADLPAPSHILLEVTKTLPAGSLVYVDLTQYATGPESDWELNVWTQKPTFAFVHDMHHITANEVRPGTQLAVRQSNNNWGFAWAGNNAIGTHAARWNGAAGDIYAVFN